VGAPVGRAGSVCVGVALFSRYCAPNACEENGSQDENCCEVAGGWLRGSAGSAWGSVAQMQRDSEPGPVTEASCRRGQEAELQVDEASGGAVRWDEIAEAFQGDSERRKADGRGQEERPKATFYHLPSILVMQS